MSCTISLTFCAVGNLMLTYRYSRFGAFASSLSESIVRIFEDRCLEKIS